MLLLALLAALAADGCGAGDPGAGSSGRAGTRLLVFAASNLQAALTAAAADYEAATGVGVDLVFGSTATLATQIENGAPADLFLGADAASVARLVQQGLMEPGASGPYARGRLALVRAPGTPPLDSVAQLADPAIQTVAIANPAHAPYGAAARQALVAAGVSERVQPKLVFGENIAQADQFVQTGNADAGLVALALVANRPGARYTTVPDRLYAPLIQTGGVLRGSRSPEQARALFRFLRGPAGQALLHTYGFAAPGVP